MLRNRTNKRANGNLSLNELASLLWGASWEQAELTSEIPMHCDELALVRLGNYKVRVLWNIHPMSGIHRPELLNCAVNNVGAFEHMALG